MNGHKDIEIEWAEPRSTSQRRSDGVWWDRLMVMQEHPLRWARWEVRDLSAARTTYGNLKRRTVAYPAGEWQFKTAKEDGKCYVYVRFLGLLPGDEAADEGSTDE